MKTLKKGIRVFVSKKELLKSCSESIANEFGDTEQTVYDIDEKIISISPRCSIPISACKPL